MAVEKYRDANGNWVGIGYSGGSDITVDSFMSDTSENPVQNQVIKTYVDGEVENAKAYADSKIGDIDTLLDSVNGEII